MDGHFFKKVRDAGLLEAELHLVQNSMEGEFFSKEKGQLNDKKIESYRSL